MKKPFKVILLAFLAIGIVSCEKEESAISPQKSVPVSNQILESNLKKSTSEALEGIANLKAINSKTSQNDKRFGKFHNVNIQEAIYYIEATLNYDFHRSIKGETDFESLTDNVQLTVNSDGTIDAAQLDYGYNHFLTSINNHTPSDPTKTILVSNIWVSEVNEVGAVFQLETTYSTSMPIVEPLSINDDWWPMFQAGKCDGTMVGKDAADRLEELYNWYTPQGWNGSSSNSSGGMEIACAPNSSLGTWTNVSYESYTPESFSNSNLNGAYPWQGCETECIDDIGMESLLHDGFICINANLQPSENFISVSYYYLSFWTACFGQQTSPPTSGGHFFNLKKGELVCGPLPW